MLMSSRRSQKKKKSSRPGRRDDRRRRGITARSVLFSAGSVAETTAGERLSFPDAIRWKATMEEKLGRSEPLLPALSHTALRDGCPPLDDDLERVKPAKVINVLAWCCVSLSEDRQPSPVNPWFLLLWQVGWEGASQPYSLEREAIWNGKAAAPWSMRNRSNDGLTPDGDARGRLCCSRVACGATTSLCCSKA